VAVTDQKMHAQSKTPLKHLVFNLITAVGQADVKAFSFRPGYSFEIVDVQAHCLNEAGVVSADVKIGAVSALNAAIAFAAATRVDGVLAAAQASRRGSRTDELNIHYTTDGAGALTNGTVTVTIRPVPLNGEVQTE